MTIPTLTENERDIVVISDILGQLLAKVDWLNGEDIRKLKIDIDRWNDVDDDANMQMINAFKAYLDAQIKQLEDPKWT